jgi:glutathione S-transferase
MQAYFFTSLVVLFTVLLMFGLMMNVGKARVKYNIKAPATTGNEIFERAFRVQQNTIENALMFLPALCLYALLIGDKGAGIGGFFWLFGRLWYAIAYQLDPAKRGFGFLISFLTLLGLWLGAAYGLSALYFK